MTEKVLDQDTWPLEAESAMSDIREHVKNVAISLKVKSNNQRIFINLTTLETKDYCIEMSSGGFRIVGKRYDDVSLSHLDNIRFETPYALLNNISKKYRESFGGELMNKLLDLAKKSEG